MENIKEIDVLSACFQLPTRRYCQNPVSPHTEVLSNGFPGMLQRTPITHHWACSVQEPGDIERVAWTSGSLFAETNKSEAESLSQMLNPKRSVCKSTSSLPCSGNSRITKIFPQKKKERKLSTLQEIELSHDSYIQSFSTWSVLALMLANAVPWRQSCTV